MLRQEGMSSVMVGVGPRFLKRTAQSTIVWTMYEELLPRLTQIIAPPAVDLGVKGGWP
jgi:solute carrier family 25, member 38